MGFKLWWRPFNPHIYRKLIYNSDSDLDLYVDKSGPKSNHKSNNLLKKLINIYTSHTYLVFVQ